MCATTAGLCSAGCGRRALHMPGKYLTNCLWSCISWIHLFFFFPEVLVMVSEKTRVLPSVSHSSLRHCLRPLTLCQSILYTPSNGSFGKKLTALLNFFSAVYITSGYCAYEWISYAICFPIEGSSSLVRVYCTLESFIAIIKFLQKLLWLAYHFCFYIWALRTF